MDIALSPGDLAHIAVARQMTGEQLSASVISAELVESGATPRQAASTTKIVCALMHTVTSASLRKWLDNN